MQMLHQAKWFGLSVALHLAAVAGIYAVALSDVQHVPKTIMVVLDNLDLPEMSRKEVNRTPARAVVRPVNKVTQDPVIARQKPGPQLQHSVVPPASVVKTVSVENNDRQTKQSSPDRTVVADHSVTGSPAPQSIISVGDKRADAEKAQQRYLKENFRYISDLIAGRLVYPAIARRMQWSGRVLVSFTITEDGSAIGIRVVKSSGHTILDNNALETVRNTAPFPRPPVRAGITVPISYSMMR